MKDDKIQGILFSQAQLVDLAHYSPRQKAVKTMLAKKRALKHWGERHQQELMHTLKTDTALLAVKVRGHSVMDGSELQKRLKKPQ